MVSFIGFCDLVLHDGFKTVSLTFILLVFLSGCQQYPQQKTAVIPLALPSNLSCVNYADVRTLTGTSLSPALLSGDKLLFLGGYYGCNPIQYGDLVMFHRGDKKNVAKFVRGLSGDQLAVQEIAPNQWRIELNGQSLHNSLGDDFILSEKKSALIRLYARKLKADEVLLLGDKSIGSHDGSVFGLVKTDQLTGKIVFLRHSLGN